ncbi:hypothetical protein HNP50_000078 [Elizabethkingia anophelis]|nr:hypothetical protein [Elizabethkingia anophelis]MCW2465705.1 hypothetical protein [Elizabethkingia anophelis]MCW2469390.1 hypothetical protein [Elizabethkingia anophelis]
MSKLKSKIYNYKMLVNSVLYGGFIDVIMMK